MSFVVYRITSDTNEEQWVGVSDTGEVLWELTHEQPDRLVTDPLGYLAVSSSGGVEAFRSNGSPRWAWSDENGEDAKFVVSDGAGGALVIIDDSLDATQYRLSADGVGTPLTLSASSLTLSDADPLAACLSGDGTVLMVMFWVSPSTIPGIAGFDTATGVALWTYQLGTAPPGFQNDGIELLNVPGSDDVVAGYSEATDDGQSPTVTRLHFPNGIRQAPLEKWKVQTPSADDGSQMFALAVSEDYVAVGIDSDPDDLVSVLQVLHADTGLVAWTWPVTPVAGTADYIEEQGLAIHGNVLLASRYFDETGEYGIALLNLSDGSEIAVVSPFGSYIRNAVAMPYSDAAVVCPGEPPNRLAWCCVPDTVIDRRVLYPWPMPEDDGGGDIGIN